MIRRILFVSLAVMGRTVIYHILGILFINLAMTIYQGQHMPLQERLKNRIELFNEICISFSSYLMLLFTDWVPDSELQYLYGWAMLSLIVLCILVNGFFIFKFGLKSLKLIITKYYQLLKRKLCSKVKELPKKTIVIRP